MEAALLELLQQAKEAGSLASLSFTTVGGTTKAKFEIELPSTALVLLQPQLRLLLFREENAAIAAVDAIVDQQLWLSAKRGQWLTRPPWQCHHHHRRILPVLSSSIPLRHLLLGGGK